jgi:hypothetical protein
MLFYPSMTAAAAKAMRQAARGNMRRDERVWRRSPFPQRLPEIGDWVLVIAGEEKGLVGEIDDYGVYSGSFHVIGSDLKYYEHQDLFVFDFNWSGT